MTLREAFAKLDEVREEFQSAKFALRWTRDALGDYPRASESAIREQLTLHGMEVCHEHLQITYMLRLFAEFEGVLRDYWLRARGRTTAPTMTNLMDSIAAYCFINADDVQDAHEVREYRNEVIHQHLPDPRFDLQTCRSRLAKFVRWLPQKW